MGQIASIEKCTSRQRFQMYTTISNQENIICICIIYLGRNSCFFIFDNGYAYASPTSIFAYTNTNRDCNEIVVIYHIRILCDSINCRSICNFYHNFHIGIGIGFCCERQTLVSKVDHTQSLQRKKTGETKKKYTIRKKMKRKFRLYLKMHADGWIKIYIKASHSISL